MSLPASSRPRQGSRVQRVSAGLLLLLAVLTGGCESLSVEDASPEASGSPTTTQTPSREIIVIDNEPVVQIFIPDPAQGPTYALTATALYRRQSGRWERTRTENDGRELLIDPADPDRIYRGDHPSCTVDGISDEVSLRGQPRWRQQLARPATRPQYLPAGDRPKHPRNPLRLVLLSGHLDDLRQHLDAAGRHG